MTGFGDHLNMEGQGVSNKVGGDIFKEPGKMQIAADMHLKISGHSGNQGKSLEKGKLNFENKIFSCFWDSQIGVYNSESTICLEYKGTLTSILSF